MRQFLVRPWNETVRSRAPPPPPRSIVDADRSPSIVISALASVCEAALAAIQSEQGVRTMVQRSSPGAASTGRGAGKGRGLGAGKRKTGGGQQRSARSPGSPARGGKSSGSAPAPKRHKGTEPRAGRLLACRFCGAVDQELQTDLDGQQLEACQGCWSFVGETLPRHDFFQVCDMKARDEQFAAELD